MVLPVLTKKTGKGTVEHPDGFQNSTIRGIEEDNDGNLWISSDDGLYRYAPSKGEIRRFGDDDGIRCDLFSTGAHTRDTTGKMYFGGIYGMEVFNPEDIVPNTIAKRPIIDRLIVNNMEIKPGDKSRILKKNISITEKIVLKHWQNSLTLGFSCPDMISEKSCRYSYMLEGIDKNWNDARGTEATYTNLSKGRIHIHSESGEQRRHLERTPAQTGNQGKADMVQKHICGNSGTASGNFRNQRPSTVVHP